MANLSNINNKFLVTTGGNVLIGQTSAVGSSILQVTGNSTFTGNVTVGNSGNINIPTAASGNANLHFDGTDFKITSNSSSANLKLETSSTTRLTINSVGNSTFTGTINSGAITSSASIIASGNSNSFGNTTTAALSATSGTFSASVTAAGNSNSFGTTTFAGNVSIPVAKRLYFGGGTHTYISEDVDDRLRFFCGGDEHIRFTDGGNGDRTDFYRPTYFALAATFAGAITAGGAITATGITTTGSATFGSPLTIKSANPFIKWENAAGTRLAYIQHNGTDLVIEADTGIILIDANTQINGTLGVSSNINTSGLLTATAIDTNAYLSNGTATDLHGRYLGQAIYGSGTGSGDNYGTVADVLRYKQCDVWRKNSSTNVWSNPSDGDTLVQGNYAAKWSGINMESAYSEYVFYFSNSLGYSFLSQTIVQHSTNGNSFDFYIEIATSTTNPYDTTGWTTKVTKTGISSWPGITCIQQNWEVGGGYPSLMRIRIVPTWNNSNLINLGSFQAYGSYGNFSHAWSTSFDRSVNFQSKIGVGTNPSRALDVTQTALIQGAGNVNAGTLAIGPRASGVGKWSTISGAHYNQSSGSGNGSGAAGIMMIGTYGANGENDLYIGGGLYEVNAATSIKFYTHTTDTSTAGGTERMRITSAGVVEAKAGFSATKGTAFINVRDNGDGGILSTETAAKSIGLCSGTNYASGANHAFIKLTGGTGSLVVVRSNSNGVQLTRNSTAWTSSSDETLKENIKPLENVLDKIKDYRCVEYNLKTDKDKKIGFIAQDWENDFVPIVNKDEEGLLGMKYTETIPVLLKAIQELKAEIELLKSK